MSGLDIVVIAIIAFSTLLGLYWGAIRQVLAVAGLIVGVLVATRYYQQAATVIGSVVQDNRQLAELLGFLLLMIAVSAVVSLIASILRLFVGLLFLGWADHLLGGLLGFIQGILFVSVLLAVGTALPQAGLHERVVDSTVAPVFGLPVRLALNLLPDNFKLLNELVFDL